MMRPLVVIYNSGGAVCDLLLTVPPIPGRIPWIVLNVTTLMLNYANAFNCYSLHSPWESRVCAFLAAPCEGIRLKLETVAWRGWFNAKKSRLARTETLT
jgi:hypothetical protein